MIRTNIPYTQALTIALTLARLLLLLLSPSSWSCRRNMSLNSAFTIVPPRPAPAVVLLRPPISKDLLLGSSPLPSPVPPLLGSSTPADTVELDPTVADSSRSRSSWRCDSASLISFLLRDPAEDCGIRE